MPINTIALAAAFDKKLDSAVTEGAKTSFLLDSYLSEQFKHANTVNVPSATFVGLGDEDSDTGSSQGAVNITFTPHTLRMNRSRTMKIHQKDVDETGIPGLMGNLGADYVKQQVIPEVDALGLSTLATHAINNTQTIALSAAGALDTFTKAAFKAMDTLSGEIDLVAFVSYAFLDSLMSDPAVQKRISVEEFKRGEVSLRYRSIDKIPLIAVPTERMKTAYTFDPGATTTSGGFAPAGGAQDTQLLIMPKSAGRYVKPQYHTKLVAPNNYTEGWFYLWEIWTVYDMLIRKSTAPGIFVYAT